jgi:DNA-binding PucR family transcriptional regulator
MAQGRGDDALAAKTAAMIMERLIDKLPEMTRALQELLYRHRSEIAGDGELMALLYDAVQGNLEAFFPAVRHGIPVARIEAPTAALEHARRMAQRGTNVDELVRAYRIGHHGVLRWILEEVREAQLETELGLLVFEQIASSSFEYIDQVSHQVVLSYQVERDRWLANQNQMRAVRVREVLDGDNLAVDETTDLIRYPLQRTHLALIAWRDELTDGDELDAMERFVTDLATALGVPERPLFIASDGITGWAWIPLPTSAADDAVGLVKQFCESRADAPRLAVGRPLPGLDGFRQSHHQALMARTVATAAAAPAAVVTAVGDPGLVIAAQFSTNLEHARSWVGHVLGPLAADTDSDERLRETLRGFLRNSSSFKSSADELHLHVNSVKYRVQRAIERRGRPIDEDRIDVEVALLLCHWFGTAVLAH